MGRLFRKSLSPATAVSLAILYVASFIGVVVAVCRASGVYLPERDLEGFATPLNIPVNQIATFISVTNPTQTPITIPFVVLSLCSTVAQDDCTVGRHSQTPVSTGSAGCASNSDPRCGLSTRTVTQLYTTTTTLTVSPVELKSTSTTGTLTTTATTSAQISDPNNPRLCFNSNYEVLKPCTTTSGTSRLKLPFLVVFKWISKCSR